MSSHGQIRRQIVSTKTYADDPIHDDEDDFEMYESVADFERAQRVKEARKTVADLKDRAMARMRAGEKIDADDRKFMDACRILKEEG